MKIGANTVSGLYLGSTAISAAYLGGVQVFGGGFDPASLFAAGEQGAWYDPSDITTLFQDSAGTTPVTAAGQPVGRVLDKSGRGNHATQSTAASRPTYQVTAGGLPYLSFDGVDDWLVTPTITPGTNKAQVFAGVRKLSDAAEAIVFEMGTTSLTNGTVSLLVNGGGLTQAYTFKSRGTAAAFAFVGTSSFPPPTTNVVSGVGDISAPISLIRIDGNQLNQNTGSQGSINYQALPMYIGRRAGTSAPFNGHIYGMIVRFGANLTTDQITSTETWVAGKTGVML
jgi:hypothetical protein